MKIKQFNLIVFLLFVMASVAYAQNNPPEIDTVRVQQNVGTLTVDISYDVTDVDYDSLVVFVKVSEDGGKTFTVPAETFTGDFGLGIFPGFNKHIFWDAGKDYPEQYGENFVVKLTVSDAKINKLEPVASGVFWMGEGTGLDDPQHEVALSTFGICPHTVSNEEYKIFCDMTDYDYPIEGGLFQAPEGYFANYPQYPVVGISWYDAVTYCNWLSELQGLEPCYDLTTWAYDSTKNGYHLPTEAQWEKAARGNLDRKIYPWGDDPPGNRCNYSGYTGVLISIMADFDGQGNGTLPVDSLGYNGYFLYNMAGNVWEWCNDWYDEYYYYDSPAANPLGPASGTNKVVRGGAWNTSDEKLHCAVRYSQPPDRKRYDIGFRVVR